MKEAGRKPYHLSVEDGTYRFFCRAGENEAFAPFIHEWLSACGSDYFLPWTLHSNGRDVILRHESERLCPLPDYLEREKRAERLEALLSAFCRALMLLKDSLLPRRCLQLEEEDVFILLPASRQGKAKLQLICLPFVAAEDPESGTPAVSEKQQEEKVIRLICEQLIKCRPGKRLRQDNAALLAAAEGGAETLGLYLEERRGKRKNLPRLRAGSKSGALAAFAEKKGRSSLRSLLTLPNLLLAAEIIILLVIFTAERFFRPLSLSVLMILTGLLGLCCLWQFVLLFRPSSPYFILSRKKVRPVIDTAVREIDAQEAPALHPKGNIRTAVISLLNRPLQDGNLASWQIIADEFLIGADPDQANLCLEGLEEGSGNVLRICRRAGVFYAQALSSTESVFLEERMLYRYEDYLLPDECRIRIRGLIFRFRAF